MDEKITSYVHSLVPRSDSAFFKPIIVESALSGFAMQPKILDGDDCITSFCADFFEHLGRIGWARFQKSTR